MNANKPGITGEQKIVLTCLGVAFAALFFGWNFLVGPKLKELSLVKKQRLEEAQKQSKLAQIKLLESRISSLKANFSAPGDVEWAIQTLTDYARDAGISITSMRPAESFKIGPIEKSSLELEFVGTYHQAGKFVSLIESYPKLLKISYFSLDRSMDEDKAES
jgi:Tfp pilus assembly protein PilO